MSVIARAESDASSRIFEREFDTESLFRKVVLFARKESLKLLECEG